MAFIKKPLAATSVVPENSLDEMLAALHAPDPHVRKAAAQGLGGYPEAASALSAALASEDQPPVNAAILTSLIRLGTREAAAGLIPHLRSENVALRNAAISALQQMPEVALPELKPLLHDEDHDIRIFAINVIAALRHKDAAVLLLDVIATDPHLNVCATALETLAEIGTPDMVDAIGASTMRFDSDYIRFAANVAVSRIKG